MKVNVAEEIKIGKTGYNGYMVWVDNKPTIVMAQSIANACDKLETAGCHTYTFVKSSSVKIIY